MKLVEIKNPITTLSGIGPAAAKLFAKLNIFTVADLLSFYPKNYTIAGDRSKEYLETFTLEKTSDFLCKTRRRKNCLSR